MEADIMKLEEASRLVLSPPNKVSASERSDAEQMFMQLRKLPKPYQFCQLILDSQCSDYVKFQAISAIKDALCREWPVLSAEEKASLKQFTLQHLISNQSVPGYVRQHLMVLLILIIKRGVLDPGGQQMLDMFIDQMSQLLVEQSQLELGCAVLNTLLSEFSDASRSSSLGMPLEFHLRAKKVLEQNGGLLKIFNISVQMLQHYTNEQKLFHTDHVSLLVTLSLQILSWDFRSSYLYQLSALTSSTGLPFRPSQDFSTILLNPSLLQLFVTMFSKTLASPDLVLSMGQCLSQLASLSGPVFSSDQEKISYVINYVRGMLTAINESTWSISSLVVYHVSQSFRHLVTTFQRDCFLSLGEELLSSFVQLIFQFVQFTCQRTANPSDAQDEEDVARYEESLCFLLEIVVRLLEGPNDALKQFLIPMASNLFNVYLQSKLTAPLGTKKCETLKEVNVDLEEDDLEAYEDELSYIGAISRCILEHSLPQLITTLQHCISQCSTLLEKFVCDSTSVADHIDHLEGLYENAHWVLLVATYTVADVVVGEDSIIPMEIMQYSKSLGPQPPGVALQDIVVSDRIITDSSFLLSLDPVVCLVSCICRWCMVEKAGIDSGLKDLISPQTSETAVWALTMILSPYLMMDEKCYEELSIPLVEVFGVDSDSAKWLLNFVLDKILYNLSMWYSEEKLVSCTLRMLTRLATTNKRRSSYLISCEQLWYLMRAFANGHQPFNILAPDIQTEVVAGLLACATGPRKNQYLNELLTPLSTRLNSLVSLENFQFRCHEDSVRLPLISLLEALSGIALATHTSMVDHVFSFLVPVLYTCVQLFNLFVEYQDVTLSILRLFSSVAEIFTIFLDDNDAKKLYDVAMSLITIYSKSHTAKYQRGGVLAEEEECDDLVLFIQILSHLTTKDYLDFGAADQPEETTSVKPVQVVMKGLSIVLPLINEELLKYPNLCKHFYDLLHYVCEIFPEGIAMLDPEGFHQVSNLIDLGCSRYGQEVCKLCVENVESISGCSECEQSPLVLSSYQRFLKNLFQHIISVDFDSNMIAVYAGAIFQLICSLKDHHDELLQALLSACITDSDQVQLQTTIHQMVSTVSLDGTKANKDKFKKNLKDLLPTMRGYLCVK